MWALAYDPHMKTIGILTKPNFPDVKHTLNDLVSWLREHEKAVVLDGTTAALIGETSELKKSQLAHQAEILLVLGGDGTMLNAARLAEEQGIPILGVNMGGLGFLTETTLDQLYHSLEKVFAGDFQVEERLMLRARIERHGEHVAHSSVLNDVIVSKGTLARMIEVQVSIDNQRVTNLRGDGLIVSSPTGSTGYSLSAGGPILNPALRALTLTPICPHTLTHRPLVVESSAVVAVTLTSQEDGAMATFDGQVSVGLIHGDMVTIRASDHRAKLIRFPDTSYYHVLTEKLKWGGT